MFTSSSSSSTILFLFLFTNLGIFSSSSDAKSTYGYCLGCFRKAGGDVTYELIRKFVFSGYIICVSLLARLLRNNPFGTELLSPRIADLL